MYIARKLHAGFYYLLISSVLIFMVSILMNPETVSAGVRLGLDRCYRVLIPSLFPFIVACKLLSFMMSTSRFGNSKFLRMTALLLFGFVGGFPVGASMLAEYVDSKIMSEDNASRWLCGLVNPGPAFVISAVGSGMLNNSVMGSLIYIALVGASVVCLVFFAGSGRSFSKKLDSTEVKQSINIVEVSVLTMLSLCGYVVLFSGMLQLINSKIDNELLKYIVSSFVEVTSGVDSAMIFGGEKTLYLITGAISVCGLSTVFQVLQIASKRKISLKPFLYSRILHLPVSCLILYLELSFLPETAYEVINVAGNTAELFCASPEFSFFALLSCIILMFGEKTIRLFTDMKKMI